MIARRLTVRMPADAKPKPPIFQPDVSNLEGMDLDTSINMMEEETPIAASQAY